MKPCDRVPVRFRAVRSAPLLLLPVPRKGGMDGGIWIAPPAPAIRPPDDPAGVFRRELGARSAGMHEAPTIRFHPADAAPRGLTVPAESAEAYALRVSREGVDIWAQPGPGRLRGVTTLRQLLRQYGNRVPCVRIVDAPALPRRGVQLCFPQGHTECRPAYLRRLVPLLARWKINELYLYLESYFDFPSLPGLAGPGAMTPEEARAIDALCRDYHISLIPMLNTLAHCGELLATQRFQRLTEYKPPEDRLQARPFNLCSSSRAVERLIDGMLDDFMDCFSAATIHVGGDEVSCIGECPTCKRRSPSRSASERYASYYGRILDRLARRGRRGGIWGDMLLHDSESMGAAARAGFFRPWREKRAVIYDWHYDGGGSSSLERFVSHGLETIACSSTHLCYSSSVWPAQRENQRVLFADAVKAGAAGGMTTAWGNFTGLHEEQFGYLQAAGAAALWSGPAGGFLAPGLTTERFEQAWRLQRYGLRTAALTDFLHVLGDGKGPVLSALPMKGHGLRKCLYHTVNPLDFWAWAGGALRGPALARYRRGLARARRLWAAVERDPAFSADADLSCLAGPLLGHEHLLARLEAIEKAYRFYDRAALSQARDPAAFRRNLDRAAAALEAHAGDFGPILDYLARMRRDYGLERSSLHRVRAVRANLLELAALLRHLKRSHRPLPAFQQFHNVFLEPYRTAWYGDREHEWAAEPPRFRRFSLRENKPLTWGAHKAEKETGS